MNIIPKRSDKPGVPLDWKWKGEIQCRLSSIDIDTFIKYNGSENITVLDGYEFTGSIHSKRLFPHMALFKQIKQEQDELKDKKDQSYNPALREMAKTYLNAFTGKLLQEPHYEAIRYLKN